ncbi:TerB family tellurite resistance protein [Tenacibaculum sp. C7A-26P2]|uniref:tellurite resistance TerB family protein n=1 Tax=Tenacibaculum sp. C7A-26P2 TaxID=3447504 RepID=UPI003F844340
MSISDLYSKGKHLQEIGHFASIIKIAIVDNVITKEEQKLLDRAAKKLNISDEEYQKILKNPEKYPVNPPIEYEERIARLYTLTKMIFADEKIDKKEVGILNKIAVALNFPLQNIEKICDEAIHLVLNDDDLTIFNSAIKKVNQNL